MPRARCRRTVLRSSPTLRAMAETVSPCRFKSWIKTISPSVTTCASPPFVGDEVGMAAAAGFRRASLHKLAGGAQGWGVFIRHIRGGYDRRLQAVRAIVAADLERRDAFASDQDAAAAAPVMAAA